TKPPFKVGPVYVRALISPTLGDVTVNVFFGLDLPPETDTSAIEQDLYFIWPFDVAGDPKLGPPDPALAKQVEELGFSPMNDGRLAMTARNLYVRAADGRSVRETIPGGAPFVTFIRTTGGPMGIGAPGAQRDAREHRRRVGVPRSLSGAAASDAGRAVRLLQRTAIVGPGADPGALLRARQPGRSGDPLYDRARRPDAQRARRDRADRSREAGA